MGRDDPAERQRKRALEAIESALRRGQAEPAIEALLKLAPAERSPMLAPVARLARAEIQRAFRARAWSRLTLFAARAEREPRLLSAGAAGAPGAIDDEPAARWAFLWGAAQSHEWARAGAQLDALRPALALAPQLERALAMWIADRGRPAGDDFPALPAAAHPPPSLPPPADPRLGYERGQRLVPPAPEVPAPDAPEAEADIEPRLLACFATRSWSEFAAIVGRWTQHGGAAAPTVRAIWILAAQLTTAEVLARLSAPSVSRRTLEPAAFIGRAFREAGAPDALLPEMLLALRVATSGLPDSHPITRDAALAYASIAGAARLRPELAALVTETVVGKLVALEARQPMLELVERLAERGLTAPLWAKGLRLFALGLEAPIPVPTWLADGLARLLDRGDELARCIRDLPPMMRADALGDLAALVPLPLAERAFDQLWSGGDEALQRSLAVAFKELLARVRDTYRPPRPRSRNLERTLDRFINEMGLPPGMSRTDLREALDGPDGRDLRDQIAMIDGLDEDPHLPPAALALWRRFEDRLVRHDLELLEIGLANTVSAADIPRLLDRHFADAGSIIDELQALRTATSTGCHLAAMAIEHRLERAHRDDRDALAAGLMWARSRGAPREILHLLATQLRAADAAATGLRSRDVDAALLEAQLILPKPRRSRAKRAGGPTAKPKRSAKPAATPKDPKTAKPPRRPAATQPRKAPTPPNQLTLPEPSDE